MNITPGKLCTILLFVLPPLAANGQDQSSSVPNRPSVEASNVPTSVAVDDRPADNAIELLLVRILRATQWFSDAAVEVRDGVVFLKGLTEDADKKTWAAELAGNTEGVAAVVNQIELDNDFDVSRTMGTVSTSVKRLWDDFLARSPLILVGLIVLVLTSFLTRLAHAVASRIVKRSRLRTSLQDLVLQLLTIGVWTVGLLLAAVIVFPGMTPAKALTLLGLGSVAIGFAFKDIFENFFAGILILWKYPFDKGDFVECNGITGRIEEITIRMTMIRQVDGQLAVAPNAMLFKNAVDVLTSRSSRRTTIICGVAYDTDLNESRRVLQKAVESCSSVKQNNPVEIFAQQLADSSINFEVTWWTDPTPLDIRKSRDEVVRAVKQALDDAGIEVPFPQRTLWLPDAIRLRESERVA